MAETAVAEETEGRRRKKHNPFVMILLTAVVVGPLAVGGFWFMSKRNQDHRRALAEWQPVMQEVTYPLDTQTVNLADGDRYARCRLVLAFELDPVDAVYFRTWVLSLDPESKPAAEEEPEVDKSIPKKEPGKEVKQLVQRLSNYQVQLNDALIRELGSKRFEQLLREPDKERAAKALAERFNAILVEPKPAADNAETKPPAAHSKPESAGKPDKETGAADTNRPIEVSRVYFSEFVMQ